MAVLPHSVHVEVDGLDDGHEYFYRFAAGSAASPVGLTRTAPRGRVNDLTFSFCTCQKWDDGFYPAYREIAREDHDFVIHLGDYTYEYGIANNTGPRNPNLPPEFVAETETLDRYRLQHALYKTDPHLQAAHRAHPFIVIWDDHEVQNDYTGDPFWFSRRANGYRAFYEHLPMRQQSIPHGPDMPIYRKITWGDLAEFSMLDTRQYRDNPPCGFGEAERCEGRVHDRLHHDRPGPGALAAEEPQALRRALERHRQPSAGGRARPRRPCGRRRPVLERLLGRLSGGPHADHEVHRGGAHPEPVVITGDWHSTFANDVKADYEDPRSKTVAAEFVTPSISSNGDAEVYGPYYGPMIKFNPHIRFFDGDRHGSMKARLNRRSSGGLAHRRPRRRPQRPRGAHAAHVRGSSSGRPGASRRPTSRSPPSPPPP